MKTIYYFIILLILSANLMRPQCVESINADTTKHTQYRRGIALPEGYQSYDVRYAGKNLSEEKRRLFPLNQVNSGTGIWTELNPKVPRVDYMGIHFVNIDTGWACGDLGTIIKTTDGGLNWVTEETNTTTPLLKVRSPEGNGQLVIASGFDGLILRSTDRGEIWAMVTSNITGDLWGLQMINDTLGWACGNYNSLTKTTDGGLSWQRVFTPGYKGNYWWIAFMDEHYGFIAADGNVLRTTNGGLNWEIIQAGDGYPLFSIDVIDSLHIAAGGYGGTGYAAKNIYSSDGGNTWIDGGPTTTDPINCVKYINTDTGYITMSEVGIWKTTNRGQTWQLLDPNSPNFQGEYELQLFGQQNIGYDAGSYLRIFKANGNLDLWNKLIVNDDFNDVYFTSTQTGYVLSGAVYKTMNGGENWSRLQNFPYNVFISSLNSIVFTDSLTGFVGGPPCRILKTTDAGNGWYVTNLTGLTDTMGTIYKIFFISTTRGWAVTSRGGILKTTDAGENWIAQLNVGIYAAFKSIFFIDSLNGWAVWGGYNGIYNTTNGGENWVQRTDIQIYQASDIYFSASNGFIINFLELDKSLDSGNNWFAQFTSQYVIRTFGWLTGSHGFIMGDGIYETINSGDAWHEILDLRNFGLRKLQAPTEYLAYSSGYQGLIYKYYDTTYTPVELNLFTAKVSGHNVFLNWATATETNNQGFEVERHQEELNEWVRIGYVDGSGTTTEKKSYSYADNNVAPGKYFYRLKQMDYDGTYKYSQEIEAEVSAPATYTLEQNFPNPFNPITKIIFSIPTRNKVKLIIYDLLGNEIKTLVNDEKLEGKYTVEFNGSNLSSGVYMCRLIYGKYSITKKLVLLK